MKSSRVRRVLTKQSGASLMEYALTVALIAVVAIASAKSMAEGVNTSLEGMDYEVALSCRGGNPTCVVRPTPQPRRTPGALVTPGPR